LPRPPTLSPFTDIRHGQRHWFTHPQLYVTDICLLTGSARSSLQQVSITPDAKPVIRLPRRVSPPTLDCTGTFGELLLGFWKRADDSLPFATLPDQHSAGRSLMLSLRPCAMCDHGGSIATRESSQSRPVTSKRTWYPRHQRSTRRRTPLAMVKEAIRTRAYRAASDTRLPGGI